MTDLNKITPTGTNAALSFVAQHSKPEFIYSSIVQIENIVTEKLQDYFTFLKSINHIKAELPNIYSAYSEQKEAQYAVVVEAETIKTSGVGLGFREKDIEIRIPDPNNELEEGIERLFQQRGGLWTMAVNFVCRAETKMAVAKLADMIMIGLYSNFSNDLKKNNISIPPKDITGGKITSKRLFGDRPIFEVTVRCSNIQIQWLLFLEQNGEIIRDFGIEIENDN